MTTNVDTSKANPVPVFNGLTPKEGPKAVGFNLDFSAGGTIDYSIDYRNQQSQGVLSFVQSIYVDNLNNSATLIITNSITNQSIEVNPNGQGFWPMLLSDIALNVSCVGGTGIAKIQLINVAIPYLVWGAASGSASFNFDGAGDLLVDDPTVRANTTTIAGAVSGGRVLTTPNLPHAAPVSRSAIATGASQTLIAANAARQYLLIKAPETADLWFNPLGGAASVSGADCFKITAGGAYESASYVFTGQINVITTIALEIAAVEG